MTRPDYLLALAASCAALAVSGAGFLETVREEFSPAPGGETASSTVAAIAPAALPRADDLPPFGAIFGETQGISIPAETGRLPRFEYMLAGTFASDGTQWAILRGPSGDLVVGEGDAVGTTARIARIFVDRVDVEHGTTSTTLRFREGAVAEAGFSEVRAQGAAAPYTRMVKSVTMSRDEVFAMIAEAETRQSSED